MEQFKKTLQHRIMFVAFYNAIILMLIALGVFHLNGNHNLAVSDFISGFNLGGCVGIQLVMLFFMGKYIGAIRSEEALQALYIEEHDERSIFIMDKTGGVPLNYVTLGLLLATMIAGYFHEIVFFTLLGATLFCGIVRIGAYLYYKNKY